LLGIAAVLMAFNSLDYADVFAAAPLMASMTVQIIPGVDWSLMTVICILLFIGAMGKSAQVPLHVWLPDSMEGPTPISALIHAATMVTAGIFMVARMSPLFELSETALEFCAGDRFHYRAVHGVPRHRPERHQTGGRLFHALATGLYDRGAGRIRLFRRYFPPDDPCFFKALLFLGAGSVIIAMHHEQDIRKMGGTVEIYADYLADVPDRHAGIDRHAGFRRFLFQGQYSWKRCIFPRFPVPVSPISR
jgi:NADH-quinone oxidoreductase subunit L